MNFASSSPAIKGMCDPATRFLDLAAVEKAAIVRLHDHTVAGGERRFVRANDLHLAHQSPNIVAQQGTSLQLGQADLPNRKGRRDRELQAELGFESGVGFVVRSMAACVSLMLPRTFRTRLRRGCVGARGAASRS